ncbi:MAG TPA: DUF2922 domain-containing protein [Paenisporosarcina sp.]|nr:DUF2922 domain-containing protein [Paenisporosarcina sp.]
MAQVLEMQFETSGGKKLTISVDEPRANLTALEVETGMQAIIASSVFEVNGFELASAFSARLIERNVSDLM